MPSKTEQQSPQQQQQGSNDDQKYDDHNNNADQNDETDQHVVVEPTSPALEDYETPPRPPPRLSSQMSTASKMIPLTPVPEDENQKPVRPRWFRIAYVMVGIAIFGILTAVCGAILFILRMIKFQTGTEGRYHFYYFGRRVPKLLGVYLIVAGVIIAFFSAIGYHAALIRIDKYIEELHEYNSKKKRDARERGLWQGVTEYDPLMEEDEDAFNYEIKKKELD